MRPRTTLSPIGRKGTIGMHRGWLSCWDNRDRKTRSDRQQDAVGLMAEDVLYRQRIHRRLRSCTLSVDLGRDWDRVG